jgi:hypothetical protein
MALATQLTMNVSIIGRGVVLRGRLIRSINVSEAQAEAKAAGTRNETQAVIETDMAETKIVPSQQPPREAAVASVGIASARAAGTTPPRTASETTTKNGVTVTAAVRNTSMKKRNLGHGLPGTTSTATGPNLPHLLGRARRATAAVARSETRRNAGIATETARRTETASGITPMMTGTTSGSPAIARHTETGTETAITIGRTGRTGTETEKRTKTGSEGESATVSVTRSARNGTASDQPPNHRPRRSRRKM